MSGRKSGLGRGLGDLLADNAPELRGGATVVWRDESGEVTVTPDANDAKSNKTGADAGVKTAENRIDRTAELRNVSVETKIEAKLEEKREEKAEKNDNDVISDAPVVIIPLVAPVFEDSAPDAAKNVDKTDIYGQAKSDDAPIVHHNRSLKALFKSYK